MRLIFVRHGEPDYQNDCLTENGVKQAKNTAIRLKDEPIKAIYSSPMGRARETASYTAKDHGLEIQDLDFMHEIDWGSRLLQEDGSPCAMEYDGHPWTLAYRMQADNPELWGNPDWVKHPYFRDNRCMDYYDVISEKFDDFLKTYGLVRRNGLYLCERTCHDTIAFFAHGGSGAVMFSHVFSLPLPFVLTSLTYGVCSVSVITFGSREGEIIIPRLELFGDVGHIDTMKPESLKCEK